MACRVAIVDDSRTDAGFVEELLGQWAADRHVAVQTEQFHSAESFLFRYAEDKAWDILLLDINLPGRSGFDICREIKRRSSVPVLVLTSRDQLKDELHALELGADEFLTKPCRRERLLARVANVLKRYEGRQNLIEGEGFLLDTQTYTLYIDGRSAVLPQNQGRIFETLMTSGGDVVSKEKLCEWGTSEYIDENALQVNLTRLKKTMAGLDMKAKIIAVRGVGYKLE